MTVLDYFVLIVVAASVTSGATRGILKAIVSIVSAVVGLLAAVQLYSYAAVLVRTFVSTQEEANILGYIAVFLAVFIAGAILGWRLRLGARRSRLGWLDRATGAALGLVAGWLICSALYMALTAFPVKIEAVEKATFAPLLLEGSRVIAYLTSPEFRELFMKGYETIQKLWSGQE
jgi:membrane protein required for colicin V production